MHTKENMYFLVSWYRWITARSWLHVWNTHVFKLVLRGLGVLNSEGPVATGEAWFIRQLAASGQVRTVVDVGANTDVFGVVELPNAKIYAIEPHPKTARKLRAIVKKNGFKQVQVHELAIGVRAGTMQLWDFAADADKKHLQPTSTLSSLSKEVIEELHGQTAQSFSVKVDTLDRLTKQLKIEYIDVLKIDTEGFELAVLQGAKRLLKQQKIRVIQFEFNEMNVYTRTFLKDFIEVIPGYVFFRLLPNGLFPLGPYRPVTHELFGFQNIVVLREGDPLIAYLLQ